MTRRVDIPVAQVIGDHPHVEAVRQLPELFAIELALHELRGDLALTHYALAAHLATHGHREADDLELSAATAKMLRDLEKLRDRLRAARHAISRSLA